MSNYRHPDWEEEKRVTQNLPKWREQLLAQVAAMLGGWGSWAEKVGFKTNEVQIQFCKPVDSLFSYSPLDILWVRFNTYDAQTKRPATRTVRFSPNTAVLMVLVKVPQGNSWKWYLLARRKYQFAGKDLFTEFSRGWVVNAIDNDQGWKLFERDFPGLKGNPEVAAISEQQMGSMVWENNAEYANKISQHLIVVEMRREVDKGELEKAMVDAKLHQEYGENFSEDLGGKDLSSHPVVIELTEAAMLLNAHLMRRSEAKLALFGEDYSLNAWARFLTLFGRQFPELLPDYDNKI